MVVGWINVEIIRQFIEFVGMLWLPYEFHLAFEAANDLATGARLCNSAVNEPGGVGIRTVACAYDADVACATSSVSAHSATVVVQPTSSAHLREHAQSLT